MLDSPLMGPGLGQSILVMSFNPGPWRDAHSEVKFNILPAIRFPCRRCGVSGANLRLSQVNRVAAPCASIAVYTARPGQSLMFDDLDRTSIGILSVISKELAVLLSPG